MRAGAMFGRYRPVGSISPPRIDRPPSINRLLGLRWLAKVLYPDIDTGDMRAITREYYRLFYHVELDEALLAPLLAGTSR